MKRSISLPVFLTLLVFAGCSKDNDNAPDTEYPVIDVTATGSFPTQCSEVVRGRPFVFRAIFSDNNSLGSTSIDIHHNFDHHSHSTEVNDCDMDPKKTPVKPFLLVKTFPLPAGSTTYQINEEILIPADIDPGDYHFLIRLTDSEGWQTLKGLSMKIR
ncbi:MAG: DUF4625 domain-containing protein [Chitinophagaceae bacterium]|nr:MAG: DUF4625 domain-containing protein [Chitinophagaceae bacterium]